MKVKIIAASLFVKECHFGRSFLLKECQFNKNTTACRSPTAVISNGITINVVVAGLLWKWGRLFCKFNSFIKIETCIVDFSSSRTRTPQCKFNFSVIECRCFVNIKCLNAIMAQMTKRINTKKSLYAKFSEIKTGQKVLAKNYLDRGHGIATITKEDYFCVIWEDGLEAVLYPHQLSPVGDDSPTTTYP